MEAVILLCQVLLLLQWKPGVQFKQFKKDKIFWGKSEHWKLNRTAKKIRVWFREEEVEEKQAFQWVEDYCYGD